jgi:hypothetical protein
MLAGLNVDVTAKGDPAAAGDAATRDWAAVCPREVANELAGRSPAIRAATSSTTPDAPAAPIQRRLTRLPAFMRYPFWPVTSSRPDHGNPLR